MCAYYSDGLSYREVYNLKIVKRHFTRYFVNPKTSEQISDKKPHFSIRWCTSAYINTLLGVVVDGI